MIANGQWVTGMMGDEYDGQMHDGRWTQRPISMILRGCLIKVEVKTLT